MILLRIRQVGGQEKCGAGSIAKTALSFRVFHATSFASYDTDWNNVLPGWLGDHTSNE
jgi:hypothetical protein